MVAGLENNIVASDRDKRWEREISSVLRDPFKDIKINEKTEGIEKQVKRSEENNVVISSGKFLRHISEGNHW